VFRAQTLDGEFIEAECGGLLGRCIQHELDHLDGKLFTDRLTADAARRVRGDLERLKRIGQSTNYRRISKK
jgi:peptide deformylase